MLFFSNIDSLTAILSRYDGLYRPGHELAAARDKLMAKILKRMFCLGEQQIPSSQEIEVGGPPFKREIKQLKRQHSTEWNQALTDIQTNARAGASKIELTFQRREAFIKLDALNGALLFLDSFHSCQDEVATAYDAMMAKMLELLYNLGKRQGFLSRERIRLTADIPSLKREIEQLKLIYCTEYKVAVEQIRSKVKAVAMKIALSIQEHEAFIKQEASTAAWLPKI